MSHIPVLLQESLEYLKAKQGQKFIDGTAGSGGHAWGIVTLNPAARVLAIDRDPAVAVRAHERIKLVQGNYAELDQLAREHNFLEADGVILDLGFSSLQLDDPTRGFAFQTEGPLDMRYDQRQSLTAAEVVNRYPEVRLAEIFRDFGEERSARQIARTIVTQRRQAPINTTAQLRRLIPGPSRVRRVFQSLRIEVNRELEHLRQGLSKNLVVLRPGGRLVVISFHSLEDRIVKHMFREWVSGGLALALTKKPVRPSDDEMRVNPRSRSAKLRAVEKS